MEQVSGQSSTSLLSTIGKGSLLVVSMTALFFSAVVLHGAVEGTLPKGLTWLQIPSSDLEIGLGVGGIVLFGGTTLVLLVVVFGATKKQNIDSETPFLTSTINSTTETLPIADPVGSPPSIKLPSDPRLSEFLRDLAKSVHRERVMKNPDAFTTHHFCNALEVANDANELQSVSPDIVRRSLIYLVTTEHAGLDQATSCNEMLIAKIFQFYPNLHTEEEKQKAIIESCDGPYLKDLLIYFNPTTAIRELAIDAFLTPKKPRRFSLVQQPFHATHKKTHANNLELLLGQHKFSKEFCNYQIACLMHRKGPALHVQLLLAASSKAIDRVAHLPNIFSLYRCKSWQNMMVIKWNSKPMPPPNGPVSKIDVNRIAEYAHLLLVGTTENSYIHNEDEEIVDSGPIQMAIIDRAIQHSNFKVLSPNKIKKIRVAMSAKMQS